MPVPVVADTGMTVALGASARTLRSTAASWSSSTASTLLTATDVGGCELRGHQRLDHLQEHRPAFRVGEAEHADLVHVGAVVDHHAEDVGGRGQPGRLEDHPVGLVPGLDFAQRLDEARRERAAHAAAEELPHRQALLAHVAAVYAHLADLVLDDGEPRAALGHGAGHLQQDRRLARAQEAGDAEDVHAG